MKNVIMLCPRFAECITGTIDKEWRRKTRFTESGEWTEDHQSYATVTTIISAISIIVSALW